MAQPNPYVPTRDFSQDETNQVSGRSTVLTAAIDTEFANISTTLTQVLANIAILQRDDGQLNDGIVGINALSSEVVALLGNFVVRGAWTALTVYAVNDIVTYLNNQYVCITAHTSTGAFDATKFNQFGIDVAYYVTVVQTSATAAAASATAAATSATAAQTAETNAELAETNAEAAQAAAEAAAAAAEAIAVNPATSFALLNASILEIIL